MCTIMPSTIDADSRPPSLHLNARTTDQHRTPSSFVPANRRSNTCSNIKGTTARPSTRVEHAAHHRQPLMLSITTLKSFSSPLFRNSSGISTLALDERGAFNLKLGSHHHLQTTAAKRT
ncbi:hypothetical protein DEO72_LG11g1559 [Vigna unguiculata]|nr:hypothetical protein DEO72_LG11g1559 [Vigna unguiculata]